MTKIKHNFYQVKGSTAIKGLFLFVFLLMGTQASWAQFAGSFFTDGGLEGQITAAPPGGGGIGAVAINGFLDTAKWRTITTTTTTGLTTSGIVVSTANARSGANYLNIVSPNTIDANGVRIVHPRSTTNAGQPTRAKLVSGTAYVIQFYYKPNVSNTIYPYTGVLCPTGAKNSSYYGPAVTTTITSSGWIKAVSVVPAATFANTPDTESSAGIFIPGSTATNAFFDDFVIYAGNAVDDTAPDTPGSLSVDSSSGTQNVVTWTAPGTGTDGGGYLLVRYSGNPSADSDPNVNGIYSFTKALGTVPATAANMAASLINKGSGTVDGTVVYTGTALTYTDVIASPSTYYYKIYTVDKAFNYSNEITATGAPLVTTWNGSAWSNGNPSSTVEAFIAGTYSGAGFDAKKLTVNSGSLTITSGNLTVQNEVINNVGANGIVIENNANLIQVNSAAVNTGNVVVKRNSSLLKRLDYTLWSSPVTGQNLAAFSPLTSQSPNRFYTYNTAANVYAETPYAASFAAGAGYLIRMPNTADPVTPTAYPGVFTGVPNNGDIPFTLVNGGPGFRYNLVGNPYPSPITISAFVTDNANITGTLYFWRKTNGAGSAYCSWTGGVFTTNGNAQSVDPAGVIQTGQGFIVEANGSGTALTFKNTQRVANTTGQFFRTKQAATADRVWLNATNTAGDFSQTAVNYTTDATPGVDAFDGKYINDSAFALTSNINNEEYVIQGRPAFDASDVVPLNFKTAAAGDYTIAIDHAEGVFAAGQDVYLVDNTTGAETNLKSGSYTFTASAGVSNSRFALKYQKTLGVNDTVFNDNNVAVYQNKGVVYVNSGAVAIANVKVYDIQGKLLAELKDVKSTSAAVNLKASSQVLVVKVTAEDGAVVTKKVVN